MKLPIAFTLMLLLCVPASAHAQEEPEVVVLGERANMDFFPACFTEEAARAVALQARKTGTGFDLYANFFDAGLCGVVAGPVIFDRLVDEYIDTGLTTPEKMMREIEMRVLSRNGPVRVWGFLSIPVRQEFVCGKKCA